VAYLRKRYQALSEHHFFRDMQYTEDPEEMMDWMPLVMEGRNPNEPVAATRAEMGTDINFGSLTRHLIAYLKNRARALLYLRHEVRHLHRESDGRWCIRVRDKITKEERSVHTKFVFLGAGGGALPLLQKSGIPEGKGYGGFPVSGLWLRCNNPELITRHQAKVYGKASVGSPPMSVPHLDTRMIDGKKGLLFGPFAGFTTKYLKNGSPLDFPLAIKPDNLIPMTAAGLQNIDLTRYLIGQVLQSPKARLEALKEYLPTARMKDWRIEVAGQRVQVIKKDPKKGGILYFGTEVICSADGSIAALLGASPGASTSVAIMLELIQNCFKDKIQTAAWQSKLKHMIPSYGESLASDISRYEDISSFTNEMLGLEIAGVYS
jgi:malate dehydrogenase (quinone)